MHIRLRVFDYLAFEPNIAEIFSHVIETLKKRPPGFRLRKVSLFRQI